MKDCAYYQELISCLLDRELTVEEGQDLAAHARTCQECQAVYTAFSSLSGMLSDDLIDPPEELGETVMAEIRRDSIRKRHKAPKLNGKVLSLAAVAVLVIGLGSLTLPRLLGRKGAAMSAAPQAAVEYAAAEEASAAYGSYAVDDSPADFGTPIPVSDSFAAPAKDTTMSEQDMISEAIARSEEPETTAEIVDVSGQGRGRRISSLLVGTPGDLPASRTPDRRFLLRFDVDGVSSQVLISVYGEKVFYISLSGEESDMMLADCSWQTLRDAIYN